MINENIHFNSLVLELNSLVHLIVVLFFSSLNPLVTQSYLCLVYFFLHIKVCNVIHLVAGWSGLLVFLNPYGNKEIYFSNNGH